jgi:hypothetical protein
MAVTYRHLAVTFCPVPLRSTLSVSIEPEAPAAMFAGAPPKLLPAWVIATTCATVPYAAGAKVGATRHCPGARSP